MICSRTVSESFDSRKSQLYKAHRLQTPDSSIFEGVVQVMHNLYEKIGGKKRSLQWDLEHSVSNVDLSVTYVLPCMSSCKAHERLFHPIEKLAWSSLSTILTRNSDMFRRTY